MTWHEGKLSVGYEIRRLTGKLDLTGTTWIRGCGWTEIMSCGFAIARSPYNYLGEKKNYYLEMLTAVAIGW